MDNKAIYPSYNGLSRAALFWGVPLMAIVFIALLSLAVSVTAAYFFGVGGVSFGAIALPVLLYVKRTCETDDQAMRIAALEMRILWKRRKTANQFGNTYTLSPTQYGRRAHVFQRYFKKSAGN